MTREEAIELFKDVEVLVFRDVKQKYSHEDIEEAFKLAIEVLASESTYDIPTKGLIRCAKLDSAIQKIEDELNSLDEEFFEFDSGCGFAYRQCLSLLREINEEICDKRTYRK